ncbi:MAG: class I SAM-dependent methyltransferase [Acidimicrobiales bacterium]|nr:class I SAM-dependent methyltransferase [Acidimicrobiales bacterium]
MHVQAYDFVARATEDLRQRGQGRMPPGTTVLEIGSLDINGSIRPLFAGASSYHGVDIVAGPGVDEIADAATWVPPRQYSVVICAEVLEHAPAWRDILAMMWQATEPSGRLLMTCATEPRPPHSAIDGLALRPDEYYANVPVASVVSIVQQWRAASWSVDWARDRGDLYLSATKSPATCP